MSISVLTAIQMVFLLCTIELQEGYGDKIKNCFKTDVNGTCMCCMSGYRGSTCSLNCKQCSSRFVLGKHCSYSCRNGLFGDTCNNTCPTTCAKGVSGAHFCTETNGMIECDYGCIKGYTGKQCSNCEDNHYHGDLCNIMCSKGCISETCHRSGHCILGCVDGFYGGRCYSQCGSNCMRGKCTQDINSTYVCTEGCVDGYMGSNCAKKCPVQCATCEQLNGRCLSCVAHYVYWSETGECENQLASPVWVIIGVTVILVFLGVSVFVLVTKKCNAKCKKGDAAEEGELKNPIYTNDDVECNGHNKKGKEVESNNTLLLNKVGVEDDTRSYISDGPKPCYNNEDNRSEKSDSGYSFASDGPVPCY